MEFFIKGAGMKIRIWPADAAEIRFMNQIIRNTVTSAFSVMKIYILLRLSDRKGRSSKMDIDKRNKIVEEHLWCIESVIRQNMALVAGAHLDKDDVYQALAERMIRAAMRYDAAKGRSLKGYIFDQLRFELLTCAGPRSKYGFVGAPYKLQNAVVSIESLEENNLYWEGRVSA